MLKSLGPGLGIVLLYISLYIGIISLHKCFKQDLLHKTMFPLFEQFIPFMMEITNRFKQDQFNIFSLLDSLIQIMNQIINRTYFHVIRNTFAKILEFIFVRLIQIITHFCTIFSIYLCSNAYSKNRTHSRYFHSIDTFIHLLSLSLYKNFMKFLPKEFLVRLIHIQRDAIGICEALSSSKGLGEFS